MLAKIHKTKDGRTILAVCDEDLIDRVFEEGKKQLDLRGDFYKGDKLTPKEIADLMRNAYIVNLVGENSIKLGIREEILSDGEQIKIKDIPIFQSFPTDVL